MLGAPFEPRFLGLEWDNGTGCSPSRLTHPL
jgi:hypothetical protein